MDFQRLAHHLGGHAGLEVFVVVHLNLHLFQFVLVLLLLSGQLRGNLVVLSLNLAIQACDFKVFLRQLVLGLVNLLHDSHLLHIVALFQFGLQVLDGLLHLGHGGGHLQLFHLLLVLQFFAQGFYLQLFAVEIAVFLAQRSPIVVFLLDQFHLVLLTQFGFRQFLLCDVLLVQLVHTALEFGFELIVSDLAHDGGIILFVHREEASAIGAF